MYFLRRNDNLKENIFSLYLPYTNDIGTIQEERRLSEQSAKIND